MLGPVYAIILLSSPTCMLYQDKLTTDKKMIVGYSIPDEIPFSSVNRCIIDVFTLYIGFAP